MLSGSSKHKELGLFRRFPTEAAGTVQGPASEAVPATDAIKLQKEHAVPKENSPLFVAFHRSKSKQTLPMTLVVPP